MQPKDLTGQKFGRLLVLNKAPSVKYKSGGVKSMWACLCDCGNATTVAGASLTRGVSTSCGCYRSEYVAKKSTTHGATGTKALSVWKNMMRRCFSPTTDTYKHYGGRGITVCERWRKFENFLADMGQPPSGYTLERVDNNGNYEPANCRWATNKEQRSNRRVSLYVEHDGVKMLASEYADLLGIPRSTVYARLRKAKRKESKDEMGADD